MKRKKSAYPRTTLRQYFRQGLVSSPRHREQAAARIMIVEQPSTSAALMTSSLAVRASAPSARACSSDRVASRVLDNVAPSCITIIEQFKTSLVGWQILLLELG